jgi:hypothetical protein
MTQHDRFRRIEKARLGDPPESQSADRARIAAVIEASPVSVPPDAVRIELAQGEPISRSEPLEPTSRGAELSALPLASAPDLSIATLEVQGQPFVRCFRCGCDNTIHAKACDNCSAQLDTAEQRTFNDKLWGAQKLESTREQEALAKMAEARAEQRRASLRPLPEPGVKPPAELLAPLQGDSQPLLFSLLRALEDRRLRWAVGALVVGLPLLFATLGGPTLSALGWVLMLLVALSMVPRSFARRVFEMCFGARR